MRKITRTTVQVALLLMLMLGAGAASQASDWQVGFVFVSVNGGVRVYDNAGNLQFFTDTSTPEFLSGGSGTQPAGLAVDSAYRLYMTNFNLSAGSPAGTSVVRFEISDPHAFLSSYVGNTSSANSESIVFDGHGNFFVGNAGGDHQVVEYSFNPSGTDSPSPTRSFSLPVENRGTDWIDITLDGNSLAYTSEGNCIKLFSLNSSFTATNFACFTSNVNISGSGLVYKPGTDKLFTLRLLSPGTLSITGGVPSISGGLLVAAKSHILKLNSAGTVIAAFDAPNEDDWEVLTLDPLNSNKFWAGNPTTHNFYQFDMSSDTFIGPFPTGAGGPFGLATFGGFSAAQPQPKVQMAPITGGQNANTASFASQITGETFTITLPGLSKNSTVNLTFRSTLVDPSVAKSEPTIFLLNPGIAPPPPQVAGNLPCATFGGSQCEVIEIDSNPSLDSFTSNFLITGMSLPDTPNLRLLRDHDEDITDMVIDLPLGGTKTKCVFTINQQASTAGAHTCGFASPLQGQSISKNSSSTIDFKFQAIQPGGDCKHGPFYTDTTNPTIQPLLMITQQVPNAAPNSIPVIVAGNSGGYPVFAFSGSTWQLQVKTTDMPAGFTYVGTVIDLNNVIPSFSVTFSLK